MRTLKRTLLDVTRQLGSPQLAEELNRLALSYALAGE